MITPVTTHDAVRRARRSAGRAARRRWSPPLRRRWRCPGWRDQDPEIQARIGVRHLLQGDPGARRPGRCFPLAGRRAPRRRCTGPGPPPPRPYHEAERRQGHRPGNGRSSRRRNPWSRPRSGHGQPGRGQRGPRVKSATASAMSPSACPASTLPEVTSAAMLRRRGRDRGQGARARGGRRRSRDAHAVRERLHGRRGPTRATRPGIDRSQARLLWRELSGLGVGGRGGRG